MERLIEILEGTRVSAGPFTPENVILSLLLAFVLGQAIAWVYYFTHSGLSYSRTYVQSLVLVTIVVATVMAVIGDNIIRAFGLMGALAIIRFRNVVKDTRDIVFIFCALVVGMASGSQRYFIAIISTVVLSLIAVYLYLTGFGTHEPHNGFLRFSLKGHIGPDHPIPSILKRFCGNFTLISAQDSGFGSSQVEYSYQLMIRNAKKNELMLSEL
ncbi:MAG: DUF4956 domain-containing protein, partial [Planctomycetota bacterium]